MRFNRETRIGWGNLLMTLSWLLALAGSFFASPARVSAAPRYDPSGPDRFSVTVVDYTKYTRWLIHWGENDVECEVITDHEGLPTPGDIFVDCGEDLYNKWLKNKPCLEADVALCKGLYFFLANAEPAQKEVSTKLPPPIVQFTL
jgi:hypothetical protein